MRSEQLVRMSVCKQSEALRLHWIYLRAALCRPCWPNVQHGWSSTPCRTCSGALLQVPQSTPKLSVRAALGLLGSRWRIWEEKVLLVLVLKGQKEGCLAQEVMREQIRMGWPGLGQEVRQICKEIGLPDATNEKVDIEKEAVKEAILLHHLQYLKKEMKGKKLEIMARSDMRKRKEYNKYGIEDCHMAFRLETFQLDCRANMPTRYGRDLKCRGCSPGWVGQEQEDEEQEEHEQEQQEKEQQQIESQEHLENCP